MSGNSVLVRIASIIRPPLSVSVQRETIRSTTPSSNSNGTLWVASTRFLIRPSCRREMALSMSSLSG